MVIFGPFNDKSGLPVSMYMLKSKESEMGLIYTRERGKKKARMGVSYSRLALWKKAGKLDGRIFTYFPDSRFTNNPSNKISELGYNLQGSPFSGLLLVSTLDGFLLYGDKYENGKYIFHFMPRSRCQAVENLYRHDSVCNHPCSFEPVENHLYLCLFSKRSPLTRSSATYSTKEADGLRCSFCGFPVDECVCWSVTAPILYCDHCGYPTYACACCPMCHFYPCSCANSGVWDYGSFPGGEDAGGGGSIWGGGGVSDGSPSEPENTLAAKRINFLVSDFPGYEIITDCLKMSHYIMKKILLDFDEKEMTPYFIKRLDDKGNLLESNSVKGAFDIINEHLNANRPIIVGVDYKKNGNKSDGLTDHWVVVNGRGYDFARQQYYFIYIETGRYKSAASAAVGDNRLYYDERKNVISGYKWNGTDVYVVNQIRKNRFK